MTRPGDNRAGPDPRFMVPYEGSVTKRDDPEKRGRVKLIIPGLIEPETPDWVMPIGGTGGTSKRGHIEPPDVGANIAVIFIQGNPDKPRYLVGPWGAPGGTSDAPTNHEIDGDDRQNAVTEDEEWRIERDSRTSEKKLTIKHRTTDLEIVLEAKTGTDIATVQTNAGSKLELNGTAQTVTLALGTGPQLELFAGGFALSAGSAPEFAAVGGKAKVGDRTATEKMILGTAYRVDEATFLNAFATAVHAFATAAKVSATDPTLVTAATALETAMAAPPVSASKVRTDASHSGYLSQNVDVQS